MEHKQFDINEKLQNLEKQSDCFNELDFQITDREILSCVKALKTKKACGIDKISNEIIKSRIFLICSVLTKLFNVILRSGFFPESWSMSIITPIFKSGSRSNLENYRGICVSSCLGKFFCSIMNNRLPNYCEKKNIIHAGQIGFRPGYRTSDHIFTLRTLVDKYVHDVPRGKIYACFVDFKKAFDSIWHKGMLYKLLQVGIGSNFYRIIKDMYSKTQCSIK